MPTVEQVDPMDLTELGSRAAMGLWGENTGLVWDQRHPSITQRRPAGIAWTLHYGPDGTCTSMSWPGWDGRGMW